MSTSELRSDLRDVSGKVVNVPVPRTTAPAAGHTSGDGSSSRPVVLHVVEAFGGGVAAAVRDYVRATPECEHHLLCHLRPEAVNLETDWDADFASVRSLPGGHLTNLRVTRRTIKDLSPDVIHSHSSYAGVYARIAAGHLPRRRTNTLSPLNAPLAPTTRAERRGDVLDDASLAAVLDVEPVNSEHGEGANETSYAGRGTGGLREQTATSVPGGMARAVSSGRIKQVYTPHAWSFSRLDRSRISRFGYWLLEGALAARTDVLAGCSKAENNVAHWGPIAPRTVYVPNVAHPGPERHRRPSDREPLVLVGAGRLVAQKDPMFFVQSVEAIRAAGHAVTPLWIGGGSPHVEQQLREHGIEVTGWVGHDLVREHLARADVYLHTARWEGFPITVLEAALNDIPVIVRRIRVFDDAGLPVVVDTPQDVARHWPEVMDERTRDAVCDWARRALWENSYTVQRSRLAEIYGIHVPLAGAEGSRQTTAGSPQEAWGALQVTTDTL